MAKTDVITCAIVEGETPAQAQHNYEVWKLTLSKEVYYITTNVTTGHTYIFIFHAI
jgi:hypothetical protein